MICVSDPMKNFKFLKSLLKDPLEICWCCWQGGLPPYATWVRMQAGMVSATASPQAFICITCSGLVTHHQTMTNERSHMCGTIGHYDIYVQDWRATGLKIFIVRGLRNRARGSFNSDKRGLIPVPIPIPIPIRILAFYFETLLVDSDFTYKIVHWFWFQFGFQNRNYHITGKWSPPKKKLAQTRRKGWGWAKNLCDLLVMTVGKERQFDEVIRLPR